MQYHIPITLSPSIQAFGMPSYATTGASGMDLMADIAEDLVLLPHERKLIPTGVAVALPQGLEAQIRPRSGLALKHGITVLNTPGTIDADYRGEIKVILVHLGTEPMTITPGMRIAQMVFATVTQVAFEQVTSLDTTERGTGGFGSTGVKP